ncbi:MAG: hypothetical protein IT436_06685 [Phycisphaerales bacterium]|nr:hypothetical protein [Phycisphaerales bacterium]
MSDPAKRFAALIKRLKHEFESSPDAPADPGPSALADGDAVLDQAVFSFLLWETTTAQAQTGHKRLREAFVDLNELRVCFPEEICAAIGERYPRSRERSTRLRAVLNDIYRREHGLSLARLVDQPKREARTYLESLEGMPMFVAARVALLCFGGHAVPVDERLLAMLAAERAIEPDLNIEDAGGWIERQVRANEAAATHLLLRRWADEDGNSAKRGKPARAGQESAAPAPGDGPEVKKSAKKKPSKPRASK